jgi:hypothetical protein
LSNFIVSIEPRLYARHMGQLMNALPNERVSISNLRQPSNANFTVGRGCGCCFHCDVFSTIFYYSIKNNCGCLIRVYGLYLNEIEKINVFPVASCPNIWEHDIISNLFPSAQRSNYFTDCLQHGMCFSGVLFDWLFFIFFYFTDFAI